MCFYLGSCPLCEEELLVTQNTDEILLIVSGRKKRQSLDMVPVSV